MSPTDASNTARFPEAQAPSTVNNGARALEGLIARYFFDNDSSVVATLSASLITMTANRNSLTLTGTTSNYVANFMQAFTMGANPNTGPVRVTIDAVGPIELRDNRGVSLSSSILLAGTRALIVKDATNDYFRLLYPPSDIGYQDPLTTRGDLLIRNATQTTRLSLGAATSFLFSDGVDTVWRGIATQANQETATATDNPVTPSVQQFHPSAAKAWARFDAANGSLAASYNMTSVARSASGAYVVTIATDFSTAVYSAIATIEDAVAAALQTRITSASMLAGSFQIGVENGGGGNTDPDYVHFAAFGDQ